MPKSPSTDAFDRVIFRGKLMDKKTQSFLVAMEAELGYELTVLQGCYNVGGVAASAGTHDGGGVVDLAPYDWENKVRVGRKLGGFGWHRPALPGVWGEHIHIGIRNHGRLSPSAQSQQRDYDATPPRDGLALHGLDNTWHPSPPVTFRYPPPKPPKPEPLTPEQKAAVIKRQAGRAEKAGHAGWAARLRAWAKRISNGAK